MAFFSHAFVHTFSFSGCSILGTEEGTKNTEQRINVSFLFRLGKLKMLHQIYGENTMSRMRVFESHKKLDKGGKGGKKMTLEAGGFQQARLGSTSSRLGRWCVAIDVWLFEGSQVNLPWKRTVFGILWPKI